MMTRYRFYTWSATDEQFASLRKYLARDKYDEDVGQGVQLLKASKQEYEGRFIQRIPYSEEAFSTDGTITLVDRTAIVLTKFLLRPGRCGILLIDPPRAVSGFMLYLSGLLDHQLAVQAPNINLFKFKRALRPVLGKTRVTSVRIAGAVLTEHAVADITVTDQDDALERASQLYPSHKGCIGKIDLSFGEQSSSKTRLSVTRSGSISTAAERIDIGALWTVVEESAMS
jgi:hypothetical protein